MIALRMAAAGTALAGVLMVATSVQAQSTVPASYEVTIRCFIANANARIDRQRAGDQAGAARYDAQARRSFEAAAVFGVALGYSRERMERDIETRMDRELARMVRDNAYYRQVVAECRGYGLM